MALKGTIGIRLVRWLILVVVSAAMAYLLSGGLDDPLLLAYLGALWSVSLIAVLWVDPNLVRERLKPGPRGVDEGRLLAIRLMVLAHFVTSLLDSGRFHWSPPMPATARLVALPISGAALLWVFWAVSSNRFFLPTLRIQSERGHQVVSAGPYGIVRHPGYAGMIVAMPASAVAMGSWWGLVPALIVALLFWRRAAHEDRVLREGLEGYDAYAGRVRFRLVPGMW